MNINSLSDHKDDRKNENAHENNETFNKVEADSLKKVESTASTNGNGIHNEELTSSNTGGDNDTQEWESTSSDPSACDDNEYVMREITSALEQFLEKNRQCRVECNYYEEEEERFLLSFCGEGIVGFAGLILLCGLAKVGKSGVIRRIIAAILSRMLGIPLSSEERFQFDLDSKLDGFIIRIDTEQGKAKNRKDVNRLLRILDIKTGSIDHERVKNLYHQFYFSELPLDERKQKLIEIVEKMGKDSIIFIDGVERLFKSDSNDSTSSNNDIIWLNTLSLKYNCLIICTQHSSPSSPDKAKGHRGTALLELMELEIRVGEEKGNKYVCVPRGRETGVNKKVYFTYDKEYKDFVQSSTDEYYIPKDEKASTEYEQMKQMLVEMIGVEILHVGEIKDMISEIYKELRPATDENKTAGLKQDAINKKWTQLKDEKVFIHVDGEGRGARYKLNHDD